MGGALESVNGLVVDDRADAKLKESVSRADDAVDAGQLIAQLDEMEWGFVMAKAARYRWSKLDLRWENS